MIRISALADEIAPDLDQQIQCLQGLGIKYVDFRSVDGRNLLEITPDQAKEIRAKFTDAGITVLAVCSPVGKGSATISPDDLTEQITHCVQIAQAMEADKVRVFSFSPEGTKGPEEFRDLVMFRTASLIRVAHPRGIMLLHENVPGTFGADPAGVHHLFDHVPSPNYQGIYDPGNFLNHCQCKPFDDVWSQGLADRHPWIHIKDKVVGEDGFRPAGEGDGQYPELLADIKDRGWSGVMAIEPHLSRGDRYQDLSKPEQFELATNSLRAMLTQAGLSYE